MANLREYVNTLKGFAFKSSWYTSGEGVPIIKASNFDSDKVKIEAFEKLPAELAPTFEKYKVSVNDVLIQTVGSWPNNPLSVVGKVVRCQQDVEKYLLNQNIVKLIPKDNVDKRFLFYLLKNTTFKNYVIYRARGAANQASITLDDILNFEVNMPTISIQKRVASSLSAYDDLIECNERQIKILQEMTQRLYVEWFVKFHFPGHERARMVESPLGEIPDNWRVMPLNQAIFINPQTKLTYRADILHIPMESLSNTLSVIELNKTFRNDKVSGPKFINGDTLFARITPCLQNGKTGYVNILNNSEVACGSTEFVVLRPKILTSIYTYLLSRTNDFRETAIMTMVGASGRQRVRSEFFESYQVFVPSDDLLNAFEDKASLMFLEIKSLHQANSKLLEIRDLLIPQLITGKKELKN